MKLKLTFIIRWNDEVLEADLAAGPILENAKASQLRSLVITRLVNDFSYSSDKAIEMYEQAKNCDDYDQDIRDEDIHVYDTGASIQYGSGYLDYYKIVDYNISMRSVFFAICEAIIHKFKKADKDYENN